MNVKERLLSIQISNDIRNNGLYTKGLGLSYSLNKMKGVNIMSKHIYICKPTDDKGCDWYCDHCGALMNIQDGFTTSFDLWTCAECGEENDVSYDNIIDDE